jgi:desulfoferrodoxin-like iron-binding protein
MVNVSVDWEVYRCEICGNVLVVKEDGGGELECHGQPMKLESSV